MPIQTEFDKDDMKDDITEKLPIIDPDELEEGREHIIQLQLTAHQMRHIQCIAKQHNVSYTEAFREVWNDAYALLQSNQNEKGTYSEIPAIRNSNKR